MNDNQEKNKICQIYWCLFGGILGGVVLIIGVPYVWNALQQNISHSVSPSTKSSPVENSQSNNTSAEEIGKPSPKEAVPNYYSNINNRQYQAGWNQLSASFQNNTKVHPEGYTSYLNWWTTVDRVDIEEVNLIEISAETATVDVRLKYLMKTGKVAPQYLRLFLVWDGATNSWLIDRTKLLTN
ncbi:hypothetical protein [Aerosakkonema funiforme]|uniref:hypothetical protein n=1 Tax=Aerosakkonema funiforme TaxID=1246630 RepID=UPI0035B818C0